MNKIFLSLILIVLASCTKMLDVKPPTEKMNASLVFNDDATALSAVSGMYVQMMKNYCGLIVHHTRISGAQIYVANIIDAGLTSKFRKDEKLKILYL